MARMTTLKAGMENTAPWVCSGYEIISRIAIALSVLSNQGIIETMSRQIISSASPYEDQIGFSRAVRSGNFIAVSGTAPIAEDGKTAAHGDAYGQTMRCLEIIKAAIEEAGGKIEDVIRTRVYLSDINRWKECSQAHGEIFGEIKPASTIVEVSHLLKSEWLVEIEADCIIQ